MKQSGALSALTRGVMTLLLAACASGTRSANAPTPASTDRVTPAADSGESRTESGKGIGPRRIDRTFPEIRITGPMPSSPGRAQLFLDITVDIDTDGRPDMKTLRVNGPGATENRNEISRWIESGAYRPARDASGHAVRGQYKIRIRVG